jgi:hypothetical protein
MRLYFLSCALYALISLISDQMAALVENGGLKVQ